MIVAERKIVFEVSDLTAVRLECRECGWELVWPTDKGDRNIPAECPSCTASWHSPDLGRELADQVRRMIRQIRNSSDPAIRVRLEMDDHSS